MSPLQPDCARCPFKAADRLCRTPDGKAPEGCPTREEPDLAAKSLETYTSQAETGEFARQAAIQEAAGYQHKQRGYQHVRAAKTRIEEIMEFSDRMGYKRLGLAFCLGLRKEARVVAEIFLSNGFDLASAICKAGQIPKSRINVDPGDQIVPGEAETMCNPVLQAMLLNRAQVDFNILLGLCVGHDSLFFQHAQAPCTILAVKDRLLGHNPLACIYTADSYYRSLK